MVKGDNIGKEFSVAQLEAIELFALGVLNCAQIAEQLNVSPTTITNWRRNPNFMDAIVERSRDLLKGELPQIYNKIIEQAKTGNHRHIKILLDHLDNIRETKVKPRDTIVFVWEEDEHSDSISPIPLSEDPTQRPSTI